MKSTRTSNVDVSENSIPTESYNCRLLCLLPVTLKVIVANSVDPDQTAPLGAV